MIITMAAPISCAAAACRTDLRREMRRRDDYRNAACDVLERHPHHLVPVVVGEAELLGEVGEDAQPLRARIDHEVDCAALAARIEGAIGVEDRGDDGEDPTVGLRQRLHLSSPAAG
jgi:hypothetical protein